MTNPQPRFPSYLGLVDTAGMLAIAGFLLGFLGKLWWVFDLAAHFRIQYAATLVVSALLLAGAKRWRSAAFFGIAGLGISSLLAASLFPRPATPADEDRFKIVSFNVNTANTNYREVLDYLHAEDPDFVLLLEVDPLWISNLTTLHERYPYRVEHPRWDNFGIAAYSKQPLAGPGAAEFAAAEIPMLDVTTHVLGKGCRLVGIHTLPPMRRDYFLLRNEQLLEVAEGIAGKPAVVFGDFNITPFSPWYGEMLQRSGLQDAAAGHGCLPTWSPQNPLLALPIDHALVPAEFVVTAFAIGPKCGSDHHPLAITLGRSR